MHPDHIIVCVWLTWLSSILFWFLRTVDRQASGSSIRNISWTVLPYIPASNPMAITLSCTPTCQSCPGCPRTVNSPPVNSGWLGLSLESLGAKSVRGNVLLWHCQIHTSCLLTSVLRSWKSEGVERTLLDYQRSTTQTVNGVCLFQGTVTWVWVRLWLRPYHPFQISENFTWHWLSKGGQVGPESDCDLDLTTPSRSNIKLGPKTTFHPEQLRL